MNRVAQAKTIWATEPLYVRVGYVLLAVLLLILLLFPSIAGQRGQYYTQLLMTVFIFATFGHAWNLLAGFCGLLSFGTQVYIGLAGYTVAELSYYFGVNVWWSIPVAAIVATLFAWLLAAPISDRNNVTTRTIGVIVAVLLWIIYEVWILYDPSVDIFGGAYIRRVILLLLIFLGAVPLLRLQGAYFAIATWLIAAAVASIFNEWRVVGAGGGMNITSDTTVSGRYYAGFIIVVLATLVVWWLLKSRYGQALTAVRDDEEAAAAVGIDIRRIKTMVFVISAPMAAAAAALFYIDAVTITPAGAFYIGWSAYMVFIVVSGGMGTLSGPLIGAVLYVIVDRFLVAVWGGGELTLGLASVLIILLAPRGVMGLWSDFRPTLDRWLNDQITHTKHSAKRSNVTVRIPPSILDPSLGAARSSLVAASAANSVAFLPPALPEAAPGIAVALLVPGSPLLYLKPDNPPWHELILGYHSAREAIRAAEPDTILLYSSQWIAVLDQPWQMKPRLSGVHVDENWHEFGELRYDIEIDREATEAIIRSCGELGVRAKGVDYEKFPVDSGTIVANAMINPDGDIPLVVAASNIYHDYTVTAKLGAMAARAATRLGRRIAVVGVGGLSGSIFRHEIDLTRDRIRTPEDEAWNERILTMLEQADVSGLHAALPLFSKEARADNGFKHFAWLEGAMGSAFVGARLLGAGSVYGSGQAVIQFKLKPG
jgi:ABC-type branched-subunit amino acid transport system permease subunit/aromatic ring-opening dioxygenase catalytic subunit (LigB family)